MASPVGIERPNCLSLTPSKPKSRVTFKEQADNITSYCRSSSFSSSRKYHNDSEIKCKRKRSQSCSFSLDYLNSKRRRTGGGGTIVLPTKFLLGGNITDPLNLEALDKGDIEKPKDSNGGSNFRRGTTVKVIIPPNINDPLNLDACSDEGNEQLADAISRQRRRRKTKKRKRRNSEPVPLDHDKAVNLNNRLSTSLEEPPIATSRKSPPILPEAFSSEEDSAPQASSLHSLRAITLKNCKTANFKKLSDAKLCDTQEKVPTNMGNVPQKFPSSASRPPTIKRQRSKTEDKIVSPVIPQPGIDRKRHPSYTRQQQNNASTEKTLSVSSSSSSSSRPSSIDSCNSQKIKNCFPYGNYNQYYGYRNMSDKPDSRLKVMERDWFAGKQILDIGCNIGHITLSIGREFSPQRIVGVDIDKRLVNIAQKNVKHYLKNPHGDETNFPDSMRVLYGPLKPPVTKDGHKKFPHNVKFYQANYVLENDSLLETIRPEFDVILCLSVTKWIHLNFGDSGLVRFFKRIYLNLHPGGLLILESQAWPSYKKKKKLTPKIYENFKNIRLFPNKFGDLLTYQIGFHFCSKRSVVHFSKGFDRPIYIYRKPLESTQRVIMEKNIPPGIVVPVIRNEEIHITSNEENETTECDNSVDDIEISSKLIDSSKSSLSPGGEKNDCTELPLIDPVLSNDFPPSCSKHNQNVSSTSNDSCKRENLDKHNDLSFHKESDSDCKASSEQEQRNTAIR